MITIKRVTEFTELEGIKQLQDANLKKNLSEEMAGSEGFVMADYTLDFLQAMHAESPSIVAMDNGRVIGYALSATKSIRHQHALLADLFNAIDKINYNHQLLENSKYVVVGQLCVALGYRGTGLAQNMYNYFKSSLSPEFDYCITDVANENIRSLKAHQKTGFQVIDTLNYGGIIWNIILWDWVNQ